jgi:hypothetical protein
MPSTSTDSTSKSQWESGEVVKHTNTAKIIFDEELGAEFADVQSPWFKLGSLSKWDSLIQSHQKRLNLIMTKLSLSIAPMSTIAKDILKPGADLTSQFVMHALHHHQYFRCEIQNMVSQLSCFFLVRISRRLFIYFC